MKNSPIDWRGRSALRIPAVFRWRRHAVRVAAWAVLCVFLPKPPAHAVGTTDFGGEPVRSSCLSYYRYNFLTEFYNDQLKNYFYTEACLGDEKVILSGAAGPGWRKTGWEFGVWHSMSYGLVCRFYGSVWPGPNSHFYTSDPQECASLQALPKGPPDQPRWNLESVRAFNIVHLNADGTGCEFATGKKLIRRFYNNGHKTGRDANHRFVSDDEVALKEDMLRNGWVDEGVRFCVGDVYFNAVKRP